MVKITNGVNVFEVTRGAYEGIYSKQGYILAGDKPAEVTSPAGNVNPGKSEDELFAESIIEKPISQWSKDEVKRFAAIKGIDLAGTKNAGEAKEIIKTFLEEFEG